MFPPYTFVLVEKFAWLCGPNSIESKCDLSKLEKFEEHTMTCELMIWDVNGHVPILDLLKCLFRW
jgi:hypothetical protein